ncbi:Na+/H+ antiporter NhaC family protein [Acetohalobium arabaticum]|uniref:Transporter, NhaC family (TC 2.A.35) n=1 Tax=Acetohalobium arabaticum (strain ATCC 49924 / DSM 5501 / Z-7288) TaxID=574087 RepID=D9QQC4_ACEAZ|nr:Na+/H+ antiporter NhaC family protein [Acetohalobium arabaticum]ADL12715.1 transporter, NhaC family (TC 2.A.35) [Acetohalobium arabaticum DSM 5501]
MPEKEINEDRINFRVGTFGGAVPMLFFVFWAIFISVQGAPDTKGLIVGALIGLVLGMFLVKDEWEKYCEKIFEGMSQDVGVVAIVAWFFAGTFAQILQEGGLVKGLVWIASSMGVEGSAFVIVTFLLAALFSTAVGTGYGTVVAFTTLMYPAGIIMGAHPIVLLAGILSGAAFGDNLAPVSDTTIVSAVTQETDVPGVVRSRFKYCIIAAIPAMILLFIFGTASGKMGISAAKATEYMSNSAEPIGLLFLIPFALVIYLAMSGNHLIISLTWGILTASVMGVTTGLIKIQDLLFINGEEGVVTGAIVDGVMGYVPMAVLILLIVAAGYIMQCGGTMESMKKWLASKIQNKVSRAELSMWLLIAGLNVFITINTAAEIAAAPFVKEVGEDFHIHPYRRANLLDATTSALGYIFPWSGAVLLAYSTLQNVAGQYDFVNVIPTTKLWPYVFHGWFLVLVMFGAVITGFGRRYIGPNGEPVKEIPEAKENSMGMEI